MFIGEEKKKVTTYATISTVILFLICHGYRAVNLMFSHDALNIFEYQPNWHVGIGRFIQPVLYIFRGVVSIPWLFTALSILWLVLSVNCVIDIFKVEKCISAIIIAGVMTCNSTLTLSNATYVQWMYIRWRYIWQPFLRSII